MTALNIRRIQETDLPAVVEVTFVNATTDFQRGVQRALRTSSRSTQKLSMTLPIVLDDEFARKAAERLLYNMWMERVIFTFRTTIKYAWLEPTDVIQVKEAVSGVIYTMRIVSKTESRSGEIEFECAAESYRLYQQRSTTGASPETGSAVSVAAETDGIMLDIPMLNATHTDFGFYWAATPAGEGSWRGAVLMKELDTSEYVQTASTTVQAITGTATTALGNFDASFAFFDESNSVNITLDAGVTGILESQTRQLLLNGANTIALKSGSGWEVLQFRSATLELDGSYTLRGLLRGIQGTEWATSGHAIGDKMVFLTGQVTFVVQPQSEINAPRNWKSVTDGQSASGVTADSFANSGIVWKPYAPIHIGGGRNASDDAAIKWVRRTRYGGGWVDYADAPLNEVSELYELEIWDSGYTTLKRTVTGLTSPSYTYTAADQTTDFGATQPAVYVKVYQISATRGRGNAGKGTI